MPLGSSSDAPVMSPGPIRPMRPSLFTSDARAARSSFAVSDMRMTSSPSEGSAGGASAQRPPAICRQPYNPLREPRFPHGVEGTQLFPHGVEGTQLSETKNASDQYA